MQHPDQHDRHFDRVILLFLFALFLLLSPLKGWWAAEESPWYLVYILWFLLVALGFWLQRRMDGREL